jgi:hypothetical protein
MANRKLHGFTSIFAAAALVYAAISSWTTTDNAIRLATLALAGVCVFLGFGTWGGDKASWAYRLVAGLFVLINSAFLIIVIFALLRGQQEVFGLNIVAALTAGILGGLVLPRLIRFAIFGRHTPSHDGPR